MMTIATMADRTLPLAERVASALAAAARGIRSDEIASISELVADVAAAERLAEACLPHETCDDPADDQKAYEDSCEEWTDALAVYCARKGQGVTGG